MYVAAVAAVMGHRAKANGHNMQADEESMSRNSSTEPERPNEKALSRNIWLISNRVHSNFNPGSLFEDAEPDPVIEYTISDLAKYMLNPNSVEVTNRLVGCKISFQDAAAATLKCKIKAFFNKKFRKNPLVAPADILEETIISDPFNHLPKMKDPSFQNHIDRIKALLTPYDPLIERISELDPAKIFDITGVCDDPEDNRIPLKLNGTIPQKIEYITGHLQKEIGVLLDKAYLGNGMFDLRGFDFESDGAENASRLVIVVQNGQYEAYVLTSDGGVAFHVEDAMLVKYLHFFQSSLKTNRKLSNLLHECVQGHIRPLKLLFTKELEIDYFKTDLPEIYKEVFDANAITLEAKNTILQALNQKQIGILVKYLTDCHPGPGKPSTSLYVMHNVKALATMKATLPHLYKQIDQKLGMLETEKYYLMDSMKV